MSRIITGLLGQVSDGQSVQRWLLTTDRYHDPALAGEIERGTAIPCIPERAGMSVSEEVWFQPQGGGASIGISQIPIINLEGLFDDWGSMTLAGLEWVWCRGYSHQPWSDWWKAYFVGDGKPEFFGQKRIMITLQDKFAYMRRPVAREVFDETVGNSRLESTTVPLVFGSAHQVKPLLSDPQILRYVTAANTNDVPAVQEGGNPSTPIYDYVPLGFQLFASPTLQLTCDVSGPPLPGWQESDALQGRGDFLNWANGVPDGWELHEDPPYAVASQDSDGIKVENTAPIDGDTGWLTAADWSASVSNTGKGYVPFPPGQSLADALQADDTIDEARLSNTDYGHVYELTGADWGVVLPPATGPVELEVKVRWVAYRANSISAGYGVRAVFPDGTQRTFPVSGTHTVPDSDTTEDWTIDNGLAPVYRFDREIVESEDFAIKISTREEHGHGGSADIYHVALKVHYGTLVDRLRLTTDDDVVQPGHRYLLRITTAGDPTDSIRAWWGTVDDHADPITGGDNPFSQTMAELEGADTHEFSIVADKERFAIEFDRGSGNGEQIIKQIELIDKSASRETFAELIRYIHELNGMDPDEACDTDALLAVEAAAGNPRLGWYVADQTTGEQLATHLAHSLGAATWGSLTGKWTAARMEIPQQPDGDYLAITDALDDGHAVPDRGDDLRDRVHAARNVHPLRESETAGVTTTWPEEARQQVVTDWRITERASWEEIED